MLHNQTVLFMHIFLPLKGQFDEDPINEKLQISNILLL
jgi:hypothetical protein